MKFYLILCMAFFLGSCIDLEKTDQLGRIDAMNTTLDSIETVFNEHKLDSLAILSQNAYGVENRIKNNYNADTIDLELGRKMDAFKVMRKNFGPLGKAMTAIKTGLSEERTKLTELKTDIENSNGERAKYDEFILFEKAKVDQLCALITDFVQSKTTSMSTYDTMYDELNDFSMSLLKKQE